MERLNYFSPYQSKGAWHEDQLTRGCRNILEAIAPRRVEWQRRGTWQILLNAPAPAQRCGLRPRMADGAGIDRIEAAIHPGDTMTQARALYAHLRGDDASRLFGLRDRGWKIAPNFHFGFIRRGFGHGAS